MPASASHEVLVQESVPVAATPEAAPDAEGSLIAKLAPESATPHLVPAVEATNGKTVAESRAAEEAPRTLSVDENVKSLGFTLGQLPPDIVTVKAVTADSWASAQGLIGRTPGNEGSRILKVNGQLTTSLTAESLKSMLRVRPIILEVLPPA
jgi:hypothetical protein